MDDFDDMWEFHVELRLHFWACHLGIYMVLLGSIVIRLDEGIE